MKTKLTLTVEKAIVEKAKIKAASRGISLSRMFEEVFDKENPDVEKTPEQLAAAQFLERIKRESPTKAFEKSDKDLIREHRNKKYV